MTEIKFIILRDKLGRLRHFKSEWLHHYTIASDNGFCSSDIIECGIFLDRQLFILECIDLKHLEKNTDKYIMASDYQDLRLASYSKGREAESRYLYRSKEFCLKEGD